MMYAMPATVKAVSKIHIYQPKQNIKKCEPSEYFLCFFAYEKISYGHFYGTEYTIVLQNWPSASYICVQNFQKDDAQ